MGTLSNRLRERELPLLPPGPGENGRDGEDPGRETELRLDEDEARDVPITSV